MDVTDDCDQEPHRVKLCYLIYQKVIATAATLLVQKMQYAVQSYGISRNLIQSLEKTRDAIRSTSVQAGDETST